MNFNSWFAMLTYHLYVLTWKMQHMFITAKLALQANKYKANSTSNAMHSHFLYSLSKCLYNILHLRTKNNTLKAFYSPKVIPWKILMYDLIRQVVFKWIIGCSPNVMISKIFHWKQTYYIFNLVSTKGQHV